MNFSYLVNRNNRGRLQTEGKEMQRPREIKDLKTKVYAETRGIFQHKIGNLACAKGSEREKVLQEIH